MSRTASDAALVQEYARNGSRQAFSELVSRHADWVYSSAVRRVRNHHLAEDVTQAVFLLLWQHPQKAVGKPLASWLFRVTRYCASGACRSEARRQKRERQAALMNHESAPQNPDRDWEKLSPLLDELVGRLRSNDRQLVLLRFYQKKKMAEIGEILSVSEDTARKQVAKSVERLRTLFHRQGMTAPSVALTALMTAHISHAAPASLIAALGSPGSATSVAATGFAQGAAKMLLVTKLKIAAVILMSAGLIPAAVAAIRIVSESAVASTPPAATMPAAPVATVASVDEGLVPFLTSRTDMVATVDPAAIDWDALSARREGYLREKNTDSTKADHGPIYPTFAHQMTAIYKRWSGEFQQVGGLRICIVSQAGPRNPGGFNVALFQPQANPDAMLDIYTPTSFTAQHVVEPKLIGHAIVEANHKMVTALPMQKAEPRPDILEALAACDMPIREIWIPAKCRLATRPSMSDCTIDDGTSQFFRPSQWDNVKWIVTGLRPPPNDATITIIKCSDADTAKSLSQWIDAQTKSRKKRIANDDFLPELDYRDVQKINVVNDEIQLIGDPDYLERIWIASDQGPFNVMP